ncbi:Sigma factor binding protein [Actinidia chinensis var. chinensis]|uniref:Sigma factor binding protein n=1 Tax=Actinidia chinensis var. chinensis TaxID=1590841 RepID=A0A2R6R9T8_ACTCC|nr:Sigma factor binding protein [Actinidia chinensis var. chinensis]
MAMEHVRKSKRKRESVKVVYISSPVKVKTSASRFRSLVQELTGRDSDMSRFVETNGGDYNSQQPIVDTEFKSINSRVTESSTSSDSWFEPSFDDLLMSSQLQGSFLGMFPPNLSFEGSREIGGGYAAV